ncbi:MAG: sulfatase-like hydrolase/transferase [Bryobacteraceae bacterium]
MTRRTLLQSAPLLSAAQARQTAPSRHSQPNIVFVISDQFRADNLGCMGANPMGLTPNLDALARRGVLFRSAIVNHPVCAPARGCFFTGQYEEKHGVWRNGLGIDPNAVTLATVLRARGYSANYVGKWHLSSETQQPASWGPVPPQYRGGFLDFWEGANAIERTSHAYEGTIYDADGKPIHFSGVYRDDFLTGRGVEFLRMRAKPPFLLVMSYLNTHHQNDTDDYIPPKELAGKYRDFFVPQDLRPLPGSWPSQLGDYYGCVSNIDSAVATLLAALKQQGFLENTIVLFTSDHGCHFKTRNTEYKRSPHESSIHVPLIIAGPGFDRSLEVRELVSQVDVTPTLLEACGAAPPQTMQGRSVLPLVEGRRDGWRDDVYIHMSEFMTGRILRTPRWTYAVAAPKRPGWRAAPDADLYVEYMLYDNVADPWQHTNLAGHAETAAVSQELKERLLARIVDAGGKRPVIEPSYFPYS